MQIVHAGRGGYIEIGGRRYVIEHVGDGRFCIYYPSGHRHASREADRAELVSLVAREPETWSLVDRTRRR
jgi:hypothetical protein